MNAEYPVVRTPKGIQHAVYASGSGCDGSLYGFYTLCGQEINALRNESWIEVTPRIVTCKTCARVLGSSLARIEEWDLLRDIVNAIAPVVERKSLAGAGACMHDILTTEQFTRIHERIKQLRDVQGRRP